MTPRLMLPALAFALVATVTFASPAGEDDAAGATIEKEMVLDPSTGEMITAPEYGGTIRAVANFKNEGLDPYYRYTAGFWIGLVNEKLGRGDWAIDRSVVGYNTTFLPLEALTGLLAESWENPDPLTYVFKIRDGVFWHDKAPVNGRQLTAHDVAYSFDRILGLDGHEPTPDVAGGADLLKISFDAVTATDDFTVEFKLKEPSLLALGSILRDAPTIIVAREVVDQFGDIQDWRNVTGTGPYQLTDVLEGSSWTYTKVDDYWGFDPKYPEYQLPYADRVEFLIVNDPAAITSLMRSGQADFTGFGLGSHLSSVDAAVSLQETNPNLVLHPFAYRSETAFNFDNQKEPWSDIRVRQALSMAIDQESIAENYMQGWGDPSPVGGVGKAVLGYFMPYEEWPEDVKQYYRYDPEAAENLLDEAGYPRGADGVRFKTIYEHYEFTDLGYYQIAMDYLRQIGIDVEIQEVTRAEFVDKALNHTYLGLRNEVWAAEYPSAPGAIAAYWTNNGWRPSNVSDPEFDEYYENALAATTIEEQKEWVRKADMRVIEQLWTIRGPIAPLFGATQPWIKGYNGEGDLGSMNRTDLFQYLWIDQDLKRELGG
ncbi:MAG: ABC transporter substrate-binding protein [Spirochaetaceae bacterium]|nr:ABC transporter substrate-binding protein [Spirochaetaceae bacterium]